MCNYHYYARIRLDSGNIIDADGIITTSRPISGNGDYSKLKKYLAAETGKKVHRVTIISLSCIGRQEQQTS